MNGEQPNRTQGPPLPPSPLAQAFEDEGPPDVPLPWSTVGLASVAGLVGGACQGAIIHRVCGTSLVGPAEVAVWNGIVLALTAGLLALGASVADRVAPTWSPARRWAAGMAIGGLVPVSRITITLVVAHHLSVVQLPSVLALEEAVLGALSGGLLGGLAGAASRSAHRTLWSLPVAALVPMCVLTVLRADGLVSLYGLLSNLRAAPLTHYWMYGIPSGSGVFVAATGSLCAIPFGVALAERLNAARRRAMDAVRANGEAAS